MFSFKLIFPFFCLNVIQISVRAISLEIPDVVVPEPDVPAIPDPIPPRIPYTPPEVEPPLTGGSGSSDSQPVGFTEPGNLGNYQQVPPFAGESFHEANCCILIFR